MERKKEQTEMNEEQREDREMIENSYLITDTAGDPKDKLFLFSKVLYLNLSLISGVNKLSENKRNQNVDTNSQLFLIYLSLKGDLDHIAYTSSISEIVEAVKNPSDFWTNKGDKFSSKSIYESEIDFLTNEVANKELLRVAVLNTLLIEKQYILKDPRKFWWIILSNYDARSHASQFEAAYYAPLTANESLFLTQVMQIKEHAEVLNPNSTALDFIEFIPYSCNYIAVNPKPSALRLGVLKCLIFNKNKIEFLPRKNPEFDTFSEKKADVIICVAPDFFRQATISNPKKFIAYRYEEHVISESLGIGFEEDDGSLRRNGELMIIVSESYLNNSRKSDEIKSYIEKGLLKTIIRLPNGKGVKRSKFTTALIFSRDSFQKTLVTDLSEKFEEFEKDETRNHILESIIARNEIEGFTKLVEKREIIDNNYNLSAPRYFLDSFTGSELGELAYELRLQKVEGLERERVVKPKNLFDEGFGKKLTAKIVESSKVKGAVWKLEENALLVSMDFGRLKPTYAEASKNDPLYLSQAIKAFKWNPEKVNLDYLINELNLDDAKEQVVRLSKGLTIKHISLSDFKKIRVKMPSTLDLQSAKVQGLKEYEAQIRRLQKEKLDLQLGLANAKSREWALFAHKLGSVRQSLLSTARILDRAFSNEKQEIVEFIEFYKDWKGKDLRKVFKGLRQDVSYLSKKIEAGTKSTDYSHYSIESIEIGQFLQLFKDFIDRDFEKFKAISIELNNNELDTLNETEKEVHVLGNCNLIGEDLLRLIFDNIKKHAFQHPDPKNLVIIESFIDANHLIIQIKNNGRPFPKGWKTPDFTALDKKSLDSDGAGIGGFQIEQIISHLQGDIEILTDETWEVIYQLKFKLEL